MESKGMSVNLFLDYTRIVAIIEEYKKKLEFLDSLKTKLTSDINMIQGEEMKRLLGEQKELEKRYADLLQQADKLKGLAEKSKLQEVKKEIDELEKKIKENTKNMWKILKDNPDVNENRDKIDRNKKELIVVLDRAAAGLMADSLGDYKEYVETEKAKLEKLDKLKKEEKELIKIIKETTAELNVQQSESAAEEDRIKKEIKDLKQQLSKETLDKEIKLGYAEKQIEGDIECKKRILKNKEAEITKAIDELKKQEENERTVNNKVRKFLEDRAKEYQAKATAWEEKLAHETETYEEEMKSVKSKIDNLIAEIARTDEKLKAEQETRNKRLEKETNERREAMEKENKEKAKEQAIKWIQAKLFALHPFKPPKGGRGMGMMAMMAMMK